MRRKFKLEDRIIIGFAIFLLMLILMNTVAVVNMKTINGRLDRIINLNNYKIELCIEISDTFHQIVDSVKNIALYDDDQRMAVDLQKIAKARERYAKTLAAWDKIEIDSEKGRILHKKFQEILAVGKPYNNQIIELRKANKIAEARDFLIYTAEPNHQAILDTISEYIHEEKEINRQDGVDAQKKYLFSYIFLVTAGFVAFVIGIITAILIIRSINKPVNRIVASLTESSNHVASASVQLSSSAQQLSQGSAEQASAIEETSSTLQESASMFQQNSMNIEQAVLLAESARVSSEKGSNEMREMMNSMEGIKKSSDQIGNIIKVIDDIAFQTNILSLNAAIEAVRAGEAGLGFAVVAEEVRSLAQRSTQAAKDTTAMIEANIELAGNGVEVAEKVHQALTEITGHVVKANEVMREILAASQEQAQGVKQVTKAMVQIESVTQLNASNAEESAAASEELSIQAGNMRKIVKELSEIVHGAESALKKVAHANIDGKDTAFKIENRKEFDCQ